MIMNYKTRKNAEHKRVILQILFYRKFQHLVKANSFVLNREYEYPTLIAAQFFIKVLSCKKFRLSIQQLSQEASASPNYIVQKPQISVEQQGATTIMLEEKIMVIFQFFAFFQIFIELTQEMQNILFLLFHQLLFSDVYNNGLTLSMLQC